MGRDAVVFVRTSSAINGACFLTVFYCVPHVSIDVRSQPTTHPCDHILLLLRSLFFFWRTIATPNLSPAIDRQSMVWTVLSGGQKHVQSAHPVDNTPSRICRCWPEVSFKQDSRTAPGDASDNGKGLTLLRHLRLYGCRRHHLQATAIHCRRAIAFR